MLDKQHIYSAAENWVDRYGDNALEQAKQRLDELEEYGERDAHSLWVEIYDEVHSLIYAYNSRRQKI